MTRFIPQSWKYPEAGVVALSAGFGGVATNIFDVAAQLVGPTPGLPGLLYCLGCVLFFAMGAFVGVVFMETDTRKAFFLGVSLPALITAAQVNSNQIDTTSGADVPTPNSILGLSTTLFAQSGAGQASDDRAEQETDSSVGLRLTFVVGADRQYDGFQYTVFFYDHDGNMVRAVRRGTGETLTIPVPESAERFGVWNDEITPKIWNIPDLPGSETLAFDLTPQRNYVNDLRRALGDRTLRPYDLHIEQRAEP